jgi:hypothetical protein
MDTNETERALVPVRRHGAPWVDWRPKVQSAGADTIEFSFDVGVSDAMWEGLERERETAQLLMKEFDVSTCPNGSMSRCTRPARGAATASCWKPPTSPSRSRKV